MGKEYEMCRFGMGNGRLDPRFGFGATQNCVKRPTDGPPHIEKQLGQAISRNIPRVFENFRLKIEWVCLRLRIQADYKDSKFDTLRIR